MSATLYTLYVHVKERKQMDLSFSQILLKLILFDFIAVTVSLIINMYLAVYVFLSFSSSILLI